MFCPTCSRPTGVGTDAPTGQIARGQLQDEPAAGDVATVASDVVRGHLAALVVTRGPNAGSRFLLGHGITTVGRDVAADIFLDDITVSRKHAQLIREGGRCLLVDTGSLNGSYVNGLRSDATHLRSGDVVQIGAFRLVYLTGEPGE
jgi:pSer/pThr/pTyr-binding forkhead associated (FHA) protein